MSSDHRPSFLDAYLVATDSMGAPFAGVVRKQGHVWRVLRFGIPHDEQPREVFATRREAGVHLLELMSRDYESPAIAHTGPLQAAQVAGLAPLAPSYLTD